MIKILNYINGELLPPSSNQFSDNVNPATGKVFSAFPLSDSLDVEKAYASAHTAFKTWQHTPAETRSAIMMEIANRVMANLEALALAESTDNGKPLSLAQTVDIPRAAANFKFFAQAITQFSSESHAMEIGAINYTLRQPIGVVGCISPWNLPLYLFTWKIAPAIAAGNCVVAKPSEVTPYTAYLFSKICIEAGLPKGVLNIVHGTGAEAGNAIVSHPGIKAISFTGGTATGKHIASIAAPMFKKLSLELGGKNPTIVFEDCDFEATVETVVRSAFRNQGQICLCGSRIFIESSLYNRFKAAFIQKVEELKVGNPLETSTDLGALVSHSHLRKVEDYISLAKEEGGHLLTGGHRVTLAAPNDSGYFLAPTVFENLAFNCRTNQEEIFGPVVTLTPFTDLEEVLHMANSTPYGLAASVWTTNLTKAHQVAKRLESGIVWINCWMLRDLRTPFGGVKQSGVGREGGFEALKFFTEAKNVCIYHG